MTTPRNTGPGIKPLRIDERAYEQALLRDYVEPMRANLHRRLNAAGENYEAIREAIRRTPQDPRLVGLAERDARTLMNRINAAHKARFTKQMRRYFGVRVDLLRDTPIDLEAVITENVSLVKTIPERLHDRLQAEVQKLAIDKPFDRQAMRQMLQREFKSEGYNLRRLTRDQSSKLTGRLNQARQTEVGIARYQWQTSEDERVRPTHQDNNGKIFEWANPPPETGHPSNDVQCRCIPLPVIQSAV